MHKDKKSKEDIVENTSDLTFHFEAITIIEEALSKLDYIGNYTYSNSASAMSKSIGSQIDNKLKKQQELEKEFEDLILNKIKKVELVEEKEINDLIQRIQKVADELKLSTNSICKSLAENPDIPTNLKKAKEDKTYIMTKLNEIKDDLAQGNMTKFMEIIEEIKRKTINIDDKRGEEMKLYKQLKQIENELGREEAEYSKDLQNLNKRLLAEKKKLEKAKLEENMFKNYREKEIDACKALRMANFRVNEDGMNSDINFKNKEKEKFGNLNNQLFDFLREQGNNIIIEKQNWEESKNEKELQNAKEIKAIENGINSKKNAISRYQKNIRQFEEESEKLINLGNTLNSGNIMEYVKNKKDKPVKAEAN